jgi:hypothetical protein
VATFSRLTVGVSSHLLSEATLAEVAEACRRIDAETAFGTLEQLELCGADILICGLNAGRRLVPDEYLSFISRRSADASLLLLCEEALVRPFVSLSQGRVTLIGPNPDAETIYHRLRVLLAERGATCGAGAEQAAPTWWAADSRSTGLARPARDDEHGSLTLAFELGADDEQARPISSLQTLDAARCLEQVHSNTLGASTGVLHFAPAEQEWLVCWPSVPGTLWLLSPLRLPPMSDLSGSHGGRGCTRLPAASGDIAIALSIPACDESTVELVRGLTANASFGGPSVFDAVSASLRKDAWVSVVEVR